MVGSEVDHKYLGVYATLTTGTLSNGLYKLLGLSTLLSRKLLRARRQRRLDPTRITKSHDLYRHIIWMAREGLLILQSEVLPLLPSTATSSSNSGNGLNELHVLALKMNASFLHIFVLFDHTYQTQSAMSLGSLPIAAAAGIPTTAAIREYAYIAPTIAAFQRADAAAVKLLPSSHPLRLSVKLEFAAFTYDCTKDHEGSRAIAKKAVDQAFASSEPMDDDSFEDAMSMVGALGAMAKRGLTKEGKGKGKLEPAGMTPPMPQQEQHQQQYQQQYPQQYHQQPQSHPQPQPQPQPRTQAHPQPRGQPHQQPRAQAHQQPRVQAHQQPYTNGMNGRTR